MLRLARGFGHARDVGVDAPALLGDLGEVAHALAWNQHGRARLLERGIDLRPEVATARNGARDNFACHTTVIGVFPRKLSLTPFLAQEAAQVHEHPGDARVVELARDGRIDRHFVVGHLEGGAVALPLLAHVAQRVFGAAAIVLVEHDEIGEIDHVDLLELARRAVVAGHHVDREIHQIDDRRIGLADAGGFDDDEVVGLALEERDAIGQHLVDRGMLAARGHRAHEHAMRTQRIHADAIAEQRAARTPPRRIDREHCDAHVGECVQEAQHQFVDDGRLARSAGTGEADHGCLAAGEFPFLAAAREFGLAEMAFLDRGQEVADRDFVLDVRTGLDGLFLARAARLGRRARAAHDILDHRDKTKVHAVVRVIDALDAVGLEFLDLFRRDRPATAREHANMRGAALGEHVDHVLEVFDMAALIARQRDRIGIFLQRRAHHVLDRAVVAEMNHFRALRLDDAAHDVDRRVVAVEQAGRSDEAQWRDLGRRIGGGNVLCRRTHGASRLR